MPDEAEVDEEAAPSARQFLDALVAAQRVVAAGGHDAGERQLLARHRQPAAGLKRLDRRVALGHRLLEIGRRGEQRGVHRSLRLPRPVRDHHAAAAVRHHHDRPIDRLCRALDRGHARRAVEVVAAHRRHRLHLAPLGFEVEREQRLPVRVDVVAQTRHDQHRRRGGSGHRQAALRRKPCCRPLGLGAKPLAASVSSTVS